MNLTHTFDKQIQTMEKLGLLKEQIRLTKKDDEQFERIVEAREIPKHLLDVVRDMLRYNMWTTRQFSDLTGLKESSITNKCRPVYKNDELQTELDYCFPFRNLKTEGAKFIVRNEKSERFLP